MTRTSVRIVSVEPTRLTVARLEHAQQAHLQVERHLGDLVEEQRAAVRALEEAVVLARRAGEAALLVAEQLALDQVRRDRAAVDREEGAARARECSCSVCATSSLPVPVSPMISTVASVGAMRAIDRVELLHRRRAADQRAEAGALPVAAPGCPTRVSRPCSFCVSSGLVR